MCALLRNWTMRSCREIEELLGSHGRLPSSLHWPRCYRVTSTDVNSGFLRMTCESIRSKMSTKQTPLLEHCKYLICRCPAKEDNKPQFYLQIVRQSTYKLKVLCLQDIHS